MGNSIQTKAFLVMDKIKIIKHTKKGTNQFTLCKEFSQTLKFKGEKSVVTESPQK